MAKGQTATNTKQFQSNSKTCTTVSLVVEKEVIDGDLIIPNHNVNPGVFTVDTAFEGNR